MNNEELIAKYLDGSISPDELSSLKVAMQSSPELTDEIQFLEKIEQNLNDSAVVLEDTDLSFIESIGASLASNVVPISGGMAAGTAASTIANSGLIKSIILSKLGMITITSLAILGGAAGIYYSMDTNNNSSQNIPNQQVKVSNPAKSDAPDFKPSQDPLVLNQNSAKPINSNQQKNEITGNYSRSESKTNVDYKVQQHSVKQRQIEELRDKIKEFEASNSLLEQAIASKRLGVLLRSESGMADESREMLRNALALAIKARNNDLQAECHGELGKLEVSLGNESQAKMQFELAIKLLSNSNNDRLDFWQNELDKLK